MHLQIQVLLEDEIALLEDEIAKKQNEINGTCYGTTAVKTILDNGDVVCTQTNEAENTYNATYWTTSNLHLPARTTSNHWHCTSSFAGFCLSGYNHTHVGAVVDKVKSLYCNYGYTAVNSVVTYGLPTGVTKNWEWQQSAREYIISLRNHNTYAVNIQLRTTCIDPRTN